MTNNQRERLYVFLFISGRAPNWVIEWSFPKGTRAKRLKSNLKCGPAEDPSADHILASHAGVFIDFQKNPSSDLIRELKIETFSGRRQLQPDVTSSFVGYCACSCSPPCRRGPVGDVKLVCLALWRKREYLTFISIRFVAFSNQHFADYRS